MGTRSSTPDLFSFASNRTTSSASTNPSSAALANVAVPTSVSVSGYTLPTNLPHAIKQLADNELDRLLSAVIAEHNRRGKKLAVSQESSRKRQIKSLAVPLTQGKLNAVRAAFKVGVTPSRIPKQFGISQSNVRQALIATATKK